MSDTKVLSIEDVLERCGELTGAADFYLERDPAALASELLSMGEAVMIAWHVAKGNEPTMDKVEGFRLLALHRQGARGNPSFNACRETCREIVYHHNLILHDPKASDIARSARLGAMVVRHLALFIGGKLEEAGLGEFCCSSRSVRQGDKLIPANETA